MKLKKTKQVCALIGVILLVALYASTLVFALMKHENYIDLLKASIYATVIVPVLIWAMGMVARLLKKYYGEAGTDSFSSKTDTTPDTDGSKESPSNAPVSGQNGTEDQSL